MIDVLGEPLPCRRCGREKACASECTDCLAFREYIETGNFQRNHVGAMVAPINWSTEDDDDEDDDYEPIGHIELELEF